MNTELLTLLLKQVSTHETMFCQRSAGLAWKEKFATAEHLDSNLEKLVFLAFAAENFSVAFNAAYQFALRDMFGEYFPEIKNGNNLACLCVSEAGGNGPKAINTYSDGKVISGHKTFVTCAPYVDHVLVLFQNGIENDRKRLRILTIPDIQEAGATLAVTISAPSKFLPDIEKGHLVLDRFSLDNSRVLPGDAHELYSKPFSMFEGMYIRLASVSLLLRIAVTNLLSDELISDLLAQIVLLHDIAKDPVSHLSQLSLDSHARQLEKLLPCFDQFFEQKGGVDLEHWNRDKVIFFMDTGLRAGRLEKAWKSINALS